MKRNVLIALVVTIIAYGGLLATVPPVGVAAIIQEASLSEAGEALLQELIDEGIAEFDGVPYLPKGEQP